MSAKEAIAVLIDHHQTALKQREYYTQSLLHDDTVAIIAKLEKSIKEDEVKLKQLEVIGDGLWKALEAVVHKVADRGTQRFAISELITYKQMLEKIKGEDGNKT